MIDRLSPGARWALGLLLAAVSVFVVIKIAPVLAALSAAFIIAYAVEPAISWLERHRIPRTLGTLLLAVGLVVAVVVVFGIAVPRIADQAASLARNVDTSSVTDPVNWPPALRQFVDAHQVEIEQLKTTVTQWLKDNAAALAKSAGRGLRTVFSSVVGAVLAILNLIVVPFFAFYILVDWHRLRAALSDLVPRRWQSQVYAIAGEIDASLRGFLRGQFLVSGVMAVMYAIGLGLMGTPLGVLLGLVAGVLNIVPYLGLAVGILPALLLDFLQYQSWSRLLGVTAVFVVVQNIEGWVLTPRLVGGAVGLHPLAVLLAVLVGGQLFGFAGILLAVPGAAVLSVLARHALAAVRRDDPPAEPSTS